MVTRHDEKPWSYRTCSGAGYNVPAYYQITSSVLIQVLFSLVSVGPCSYLLCRDVVEACVSGLFSRGIPKSWGECAFLQVALGFASQLFWVLLILPKWDHFFHRLECPGLQEVCVSRGQKNRKARSHKKAALPWEHLLISVSQSLGLTDIGGRGDKTLAPWIFGSDLERIRGNPCRTDPQWQGEPGQSHPLAKKNLVKKGRRKCVSQVRKNVLRSILSWVWD